jgi:hypothetical protein
MLKFCPYNFNMIKIIALLVAITSLPAVAQEGKVTQAKGNRAVVQFPSGTRPHIGDTVNLGGFDSEYLPSSSSTSSSSSSDMKGSREHSIDFSANLTSGSSSAGGSHTALSVAGRYGWNKITMEYGPEASFSTVTPGSITTFAGGGFFDYNLVPNKRGTPLVYGVGADATIGSSSGGGNSGTVMAIFGGGFVKWFPLGNTVAVRGDGGLGYNRTSTSGASTSETDLVLKGGLEVYF